jgi:phosphatidylinositol-3-phosphatase
MVVVTSYVPGARQMTVPGAAVWTAPAMSPPAGTMTPHPDAGPPGTAKEGGGEDGVRVQETAARASVNVKQARRFSGGRPACRIPSGNDSRTEGRSRGPERVRTMEPLMWKRLILVLPVLALLVLGMTSMSGRGHQPLTATTPHLALIVMENKESTSVVGSSAAPYLNNTLIPASLVLTQYYASMHPSLPNYLIMTSASSNGCVVDSCARNSDPDENLFHQLNSAGISWKAYADGMTSACGLANKGTYLVRHNPPPYFTNLSGTGPGSCAAQDVPYAQLATDIANDPTLHTLPQFIWITPDKFNDMHSDHKTAPCLLSNSVLDEVCQGDTWLSSQLPPLLNLNTDGDPANDVTVIVVFDEGTTAKGGGGNTLALVTGPGVTPGSDGAMYGHLGLLNAIQNWFGVPTLTPTVPPLT